MYSLLLVKVHMLVLNIVIDISLLFWCIAKVSSIAIELISLDEKHKLFGFLTCFPVQY